MGKSRFLFLCIILCCTALQAFAQAEKYFIEFTDKNNSSYSVENPLEYLSQRAIERRIRQNIAITSRDFPVNRAYLQAVQQSGAKVLYTSRWMNAALIEASQATLNNIKLLPFVKPLPSQGWKNVNARRTARKATHAYAEKEQAAKHFNTWDFKSDLIDYGFSASQVTMVGADEMHRLGFTGKGMLLAVFDSGFRNADQVSSLSHVFTDNRILATYDFVSHEQSVYEDDSHGLQVLSAIAAFRPGELIGTAYEANFILLRTEDASSESRIEEINWLLAAEFADSSGVDVINSSLGYTTFDNASMNYSPADMDGNTALVTRAADLAAATGMLIVNSAGNEGNDSWQTLSAPADADSVLAIGAVDRDRNYVRFSSRGPSADGRVKPNLSLQGQGTVVSAASNHTATSNGTSFSSPLMAGMAAGFWQAYPQLTNMQVIDYLQRSASQFDKPDSLLGYGIPNFVIASQLAEKDIERLKEICSVYPNPLEENTLTLWVNPAYLNEALTIHYFDVSGRLLNKQVVASAASINKLFLDPYLFKSGVYILQVSSPRITYATKFVKL